MSRPKSKRLIARERVIKLFEEQESADWDPNFHAELYGLSRCFKCGSMNFEEILDEEHDLVLCCSDCPEDWELN